jgi:hypothetical protein
MTGRPDHQKIGFDLGGKARDIAHGMPGIKWIRSAM